MFVDTEAGAVSAGGIRQNHMLRISLLLKVNQADAQTQIEAIDMASPAPKTKTTITLATSVRGVSRSLRSSP